MIVDAISIPTGPLPLIQAALAFLKPRILEKLECREDERDRRAQTSSRAAFQFSLTTEKARDSGFCVCGKQINERVASESDCHRRSGVLADPRREIEEGYDHADGGV